MLCIECASCVLDLCQVSNTLRPSQTLRTTHTGFQDLCVKVESTADLVKLVSDHQREEKLVRKAVKNSLLLDVQKSASKLEVLLYVTPSECLYALLMVHVSHAVAYC